MENLLSFQQLRWFPCNAQFVPPTVWLSGRLISIWVIPCLSDMVGNSSPDTIFSVVYQACSISSSPAASHLPPILFRNRLILTPLLFFNFYNLSFHVLNSIFPFFGPPLFLPQITHSFYLALLDRWSFDMQQIINEFILHGITAPFLLGPLHYQFQVRAVCSMQGIRFPRRIAENTTLNYFQGLQHVRL